MSRHDRPRSPRPSLHARRERYDSWHEQSRPGALGPWYEMVWRSLQRQGILRGASVLEIGCGTGEFAARLASDGARSVVGQDFSPSAIDLARARHAQVGLTYEVGDIEHIDKDDSSFDIVISCETIEHVPSPRTAVRELARVLRPGGTLFLTTPNYLSITGLQRLYRDLSGRPWDEGGQPLVHWTLLPRTLRWVRESGLKLSRLDGDGWYVPVRGRAGGWQPAPPTWARKALVPLALHQLIEAKHAAPAQVLRVSTVAPQ